VVLKVWKGVSLIFHHQIRVLVASSAPQAGPGRRSSENNLSIMTVIELLVMAFLQFLAAQ